ncbi:MAG: patatin-like phospholipase family protein [Candidatus Delongbacteria bacterium]|nr:patatin-like phospholipase family protein [Candidatus Delongbacteria bacterium]
MKILTGFIPASLILVLLIAAPVSRAQTVEQGAVKPKIGLALSGGGAKSFAHIGVLRVLEELDIEIDYITGTSMGSLIAALYANGYSAARIEQMLMKQNWPELLFSDEILRRSLSMDEKGEDAVYIASFAIEDWRIQLPSGLNSGQKLLTLITRLTWPVIVTEDFNDFPIPFRCIATDLVTGEAVVLKSGFLPDCIRASMSFPSVLSPIEIGGRMLVDGGVCRNLPVSDLLEMGADIVIGVDVGAPLHRKHELNSIVEVMEQLVSFQGCTSNEKQRGLCDILIEPDVTGYDAGSFGAVDTLLALGEVAARSQLAALSALADSLQQLQEYHPRFIPLSTNNPVHVQQVEIEGLHNVPRSLLRGNLQISADSWLTLQELEDAIQRIYGSGFFERVTYRFEPVSGCEKLTIKVTEKTADLFRFGLHYNSDIKASVNLNTTFRNKIGAGSRLSLAAKLSDTPKFRVSYFIHLGWKPGIGLGVTGTYENLQVPIYYAPENRLSALVDFSVYQMELQLQTIFSNAFTIGGILQFEHDIFDPLIAPAEWNFELSTLDLGVIRGFFSYDTYDRTLFPRTGMAISGSSEYVTDLHAENYYFNDPRSFIRYRLYFGFNYPLNRALVLFNRSYAGLLDNKGAIPGNYLFYLGGQRLLMQGLFPFSGLHFMELPVGQMMVIQPGLQWEVSEDRYLILQNSLGLIRESDGEIMAPERLISGISISFAMLTRIGPIEYTVMRSSEHDEFDTFFSLGFPF